MIKPFIKKTTASVLKYCSQLVMEFAPPNLNIDSIYLTVSQSGLHHYTIAYFPPLNFISII